MNAWHLRTDSGTFAVCEMPPWLHEGFKCGFDTRRLARTEARKILATGRKVRVVKGACPKS